MTQDTRKDRRVKIVSLNVRYKSATVDEFIENHAYDVSRGGIFIKTANPFPPGTLLKFEIRLASEQAVIAGVGRIVWKRDAGASSGDRPAGMGVKFIKLDEPSKVVIDRLVSTRADAGKAFEAEDPTTGPSERPAPLPRTTPPGRSAVSVPTAPAMKVPGARSMSPAGGIASAAKGPSGASTSPLRKATMIGVGGAPASQPAPLSSPPRGGLPSTVPPAKPSFPAAPSAPPRPGGTPMFPKGGHESDWPAKQEPTVMKQAAELLEEALREAGGSMEEIGTNPLFSGVEPPTSPVADHAKAPLASARDWTATEPPPTSPPHESHESQATSDSVPPPVVEEKPVSLSAPAPRSTRETPTSVRPASAGARATDQTYAKKKSGSGGLVLFWIAAAAVIAVVFMFREQLFGAGRVPEPVTAPQTTPAVNVPTTLAISPVQSASASAATLASAAASANATAASGMAPAASAQASSSAALDHIPAGQKSAEIPPPYAPPRAPKPVAKPAAPPAAAAMPTDTSGAQSAPPGEATPSPNAGSSASAAATQPIKTTTPPPKPKANKPADDNPY